MSKLLKRNSDEYERILDGLSLKRNEVFDIRYLFSCDHCHTRVYEIISFDALLKGGQNTLDGSDLSYNITKWHLKNDIKISYFGGRNSIFRDIDGHFLRPIKWKGNLFCCWNCKKKVINLNGALKCLKEILMKW